MVVIILRPDLKRNAILFRGFLKIRHEVFARRMHSVNLHPLPLRREVRGIRVILMRMRILPLDSDLKGTLIPIHMILSLTNV
ncbi:hypothetical protein [Methanolacinia paynteri]|uniref:hypothetical protein n=1 Tax=Methanolacinia paynteri TaxID=230356 RepID=UPI001FDFDFB2|nr:hypothetical protein [Methanolacinia paynteri]